MPIMDINETTTIEKITEYVGEEKARSYHDGHMLGMADGIRKAIKYLEEDHPEISKKEDWQISLGIKKHLIAADAVCDERNRILEGLSQFKDYEKGIEALINGITVNLAYTPPPPKTDN